MSPHAKKIILPLHALSFVAIYFIINGEASVNWPLYTICGWLIISGLGIAIGFHRYFSHRSFETYKPVERALAFIGCMGAQGSPVFWASLHNGVHHPHSDTKRDVHSPVNGYWNSFMGWQFKLKATDVPFRYGIKLCKDPFIKFLHKNYIKVYWGVIVCGAAISWQFSLFAIILPGFVSIHQENLIDLFCHLRGWGYRNHDTKDNSVNNLLLGFFAFGQGWHNNHHARPNDYNFGGDRWFEFDICSIVIPLLEKKKFARAKEPSHENV